MKIGVGVIITNENDEILLVQRGPKARSQQGKWENVGGGVEDSEEPIDAAKREAMEELGVELLNIELLLEVGEDTEGWKTYVFGANIANEPKLIEPEICSGIKWVKKGELNDIDLTTYSKEDYIKLGWIK